MSQSSKGIPLRSIVAIPCFNTEDYVADVVSRAKRYVEQVIVVNDGSHDGTVEKAKAAGAMVVSHGVNLGYGEAIRSCFEIAKADGADMLAILDGDGQHNPDELPQVLSLPSSPSLAQIWGSPTPRVALEHTAHRS